MMVINRKRNCYNHNSIYGPGENERSETKYQFWDKLQEVDEGGNNKVCLWEIGMLELETELMIPKE